MKMKKILVLALAAAPIPSLYIRSRTMKTKLAATILAAAALTGCAMPPKNANTYSGGGSMQARQVAFGTVLAVRPIQIRAGGQDGTTGAVAGGAGGAGIGAALGGVKGAIAGLLGGGLLGNWIGSQQTRPGELVTVNFADGQIRAFPQPMAPHEHPFLVGEKVEVVIGPQDRVIPLG